MFAYEILKKSRLITRCFVDKPVDDVYKSVRKIGYNYTQDKNIRRKIMVK
ncbi:hypothetical protein D920_00819 [Enterococcus faecalis 13-SD-W-01]|nr:hypothetical protein D920_00819 [Enterococcus faecalis 13-SD-W-01]